MQQSAMANFLDCQSSLHSKIFVCARILNLPANYPYGEGQYTVEDLAGHRWTFSKTIADIDPKAWDGTLFEEMS